MKILHVTPFYAQPTYGGMARSASALCRQLASRGHHVIVATSLLDPLQPAEETVGDVHIHRFAGPAALRRRLFPWAPALRRFLAEALTSVDVAHVHGHRSGITWTAHRALTTHGVPYVLQPHGTFPHHGQHRLAKWIYDRAAGNRIVAGAHALVAVSQAEAVDLPRRARIIANGVELPAVRGSRRRPGPPRLVFVGNDRPQKRGSLLAQLLQVLPDVHLHLVGSFNPAFVAGFERFSARVTFGGILEREALATAYADADLLVHPAVREAFGLVAFEAALVGTASVVAGGHGCGEWYGQAGGCVVAPDDVQAIAKAVRARLDRPDVARAEAEAVAAFARSQLTWDRAAAEVEALYREVAVGHCRGAA